MKWIFPSSCNTFSIIQGQRGISNIAWSTTVRNSPHKMKNRVLPFLNTLPESLHRPSVWFGDRLSTWLHRLQVSGLLRFKNPVLGTPTISSDFLLPGLLECSRCEEARQASWPETRQIIDGKAESLLLKPKEFLPNVLIWTSQAPSNRKLGFLKALLLSCSCPKQRIEGNNMPYLWWKLHHSK